jgi:hypothetical protein
MIPPADAQVAPPDGPAGDPSDGGPTDPGDAATPLDGNHFMPGSGDPVSHGPRTPIPVTTVGGLTQSVHDVAVDGSGGVWATTDAFVAFVPRTGAGRHYTAADGLALRDATVPFAGVAVGLPGQVFIGTLGRYADVADVRPDGSLDVHHLTITDPIHALHVTRAYRFTVDLGSAYGGTVWIGAEHGHAALHGISIGYCWGQYGCFEEHRHSDPGGGPAGDVRGLAVCPNHDLWTGDAWWVGRMPWGSQGTTPDFWALAPTGYPDPLYDVFPGVDDSVTALLCDGDGTLWVGSYGAGLAHIDPTTRIIHYYEAMDSLPQNLVTALLLDADGSLWVGTSWGGLARFQPATQQWTYYGGLPSDTISALAADFTASPRIIYIAHSAGLSAYTGP